MQLSSIKPVPVRWLLGHEVPSKYGVDWIGGSGAILESAEWVAHCQRTDRGSRHSTHAYTRTHSIEHMIFIDSHHNNTLRQVAWCLLGGGGRYLSHCRPRGWFLGLHGRTPFDIVVSSAPHPNTRGRCVSSPSTRCVSWREMDECAWVCAGIGQSHTVSPSTLEVWDVDSARDQKENKRRFERNYKRMHTILTIWTWLD